MWRGIFSGADKADTVSSIPAGEKPFKPKYTPMHGPGARPIEKGRPGRAWRLSSTQAAGISTGLVVFATAGMVVLGHADNTDRVTAGPITSVDELEDTDSHVSPDTPQTLGIQVTEPAEGSVVPPTSTEPTPAAVTLTNLNRASAPALDTPTDIAVAPPTAGTPVEVVTPEPLKPAGTSTDTPAQPRTDPVTPAATATDPATTGSSTTGGGTGGGSTATDPGNEPAKPDSGTGSGSDTDAGTGTTDPVTPEPGTGSTDEPEQTDPGTDAGAGTGAGTGTGTDTQTDPQDTADADGNGNTSQPADGATTGPKTETPAATATDTTPAATD